MSIRKVRGWIDHSSEGHGAHLSIRRGFFASAKLSSLGCCSSTTPPCMPPIDSEEEPRRRRGIDSTAARSCSSTRTFARSTCGTCAAPKPRVWVRGCIHAAHVHQVEVSGEGRRAHRAPRGATARDTACAAFASRGHTPSPAGGATAGADAQQSWGSGRQCAGADLVGLGEEMLGYLDGHGPQYVLKHGDNPQHAGSQPCTPRTPRTGPETRERRPLP